MCQVKKEKEDLPRFKNVSINRLEDYIKMGENWLQPSETIQTMQQSTQQKKKQQKWEIEQLYGHFKQQTSEHSLEKKCTWLRNGNLKRETEFFSDNSAK